MVIRNVRVFDGERLTTPANVVIEDGYIKSVGAEVPADSDVIDGKGKTLLPGFIDTHIHIDSRDNCVQAVKYGVTTLIDQMCENTTLIDSLKEPDEPIASVRSVIYARTVTSRSAYGRSTRSRSCICSN